VGEAGAGGDARLRCDGPLEHRRQPSRPRDAAPARYLSSSYYEIWIKALEKLLESEGFVTDDELRGRPRARRAAHAEPRAARGGGRRGACPRLAERAAGHAAGAIRVGERVRTANEHPAGHTRVPRYTRGRIGRIEQVHGAHVFPETSAHGLGEQPQWLYTVASTAANCGSRGRPSLTVSIDAWKARWSRLRECDPMSASELEAALCKVAPLPRDDAGRCSPRRGRRRPLR